MPHKDYLANTSSLEVLVEDGETKVENGGPPQASDTFQVLYELYRKSGILLLPPRIKYSRYYSYSST